MARCVLHISEAPVFVVSQSPRGLHAPAETLRAVSLGWGLSLGFKAITTPNYPPDFYSFVQRCACFGIATLPITNSPNRPCAGGDRYIKSVDRRGGGRRPRIGKECHQGPQAKGAFTTSTSWSSRTRFSLTPGNILRSTSTLCKLGFTSVSVLNLSSSDSGGAVDGLAW